MRPATAQFIMADRRSHVRVRLSGRPGGFTLVEVLLAATITVMITVVAVSALKAVSDTSRIIENTTQTTAGVRFAAQMLERDLHNLYRDADSQNMLLIGTSQGADSGEPPSLRFYTVGRMKARVDQPEGDVYEVEYMLGQPKVAEGKVAGDTESSPRTLYRRWWPNPDRKRQPGGMLSAIAENIDVFQIRFHNGKEWVDQWTEDKREMPQLIEITLALMPEQRGEPTVQTFLVSFPRLATPTSGSPGGPGSDGSSNPNQPGEAQQQQSGGSPGAEPSGGQPAGPGGR